MKPARTELDLVPGVARGLVHASPLWEGAGVPFDHSPRRTPLAFMGNAAWIRGGAGLAARTTGASGSYLRCAGLGSYIGVGNPWTVIIRGRLAEAPVLKGLFNLTRGPGGDDRLATVYWNTAGNNGITMQVRSSFATNYVTLSSYPDITVPHTYAFTHDGAQNRTNAFVYVDGVDLTRRTVDSTLSEWGTDALTIGEGFNASLNSDTEAEYALVFDRQLGPGELVPFSPPDPFAWMRMDDINPAVFQVVAPVPGGVIAPLYQGGAVGVVPQ